jgi:uncharacterized Zn-finger protein
LIEIKCKISQSDENIKLLALPYRMILPSRMRFLQKTGAVLNSRRPARNGKSKISEQSWMARTWVTGAAAAGRCAPSMEAFVAVHACQSEDQMPPFQLIGHEEKGRRQPGPRPISHHRGEGGDKLITGGFDMAQIVEGCDTVAQVLAARLNGPYDRNCLQRSRRRTIQAIVIRLCCVRFPLPFPRPGNIMATHSTPHFHNQPGVPQVRVGAKEFMCVGALPPFDHPHIFIDMGEDNDAICPYCSTHFAYDETLHGGCEPAECVFEPAEPAIAQG